MAAQDPIVNAPDARQLPPIQIPHRFGLNDGTIVPQTHFPPGSSPSIVRNPAQPRSPLRGTIRCIVVLVDFPDKAIHPRAAQRFTDLLFSGKPGSLAHYYEEVSRGLVNFVGDVFGTFRVSRTKAEYANNEAGLGVAPSPNLQTLAADAYAAVEPFLDDTAQYDSDSNGYIDAFIVVHAGQGAEATHNPADLWSAKWVMPEAIGDGKSKLYAFLTLPEDAKLGMACHEIGHLVFGWPDLHVPLVDYEPAGEKQNAGLGDWCLMASGGWIGSGDTPSHPSAWCKKQQGWVEVVNETSDRSIAITDVKVDGKVHRLWRNGDQTSSEYFLVENRGNAGYDAALPGHGLLIYHIDDSMADNMLASSPRVALVQADGKSDLEEGVNRGDAGDVFPGSTSNTSFTLDSNPNSKAYDGTDTLISIKNIDEKMVVTISVGFVPE